MSENKSKSRSKYDQANFISKLYCWYVLPFLLQNYKKNFNFDVFDDCSKEHICTKHANRLKRYWSNEIENSGKINRRKPSLLVALVKCFGLLYLWTNVKSIFVYGILRMVMPVILGRIIFYSNLYLVDDVRQDYDQIINNSSVILLSTDLLQLANAQNVLLYSVLLCFVIFCHVLFAQPLFMSRFRYGMRFRLALTRLIYEKALRIPNESVQTNTSGKIVNLISNDVSRFDSAYHFWEFVYTGILQTAVGMYFMYLYIGRSCLGTLVIIVLYIPFQTVMANILSRIRSSAIALTDDRLRLMAEILPAMRVIKMYVWEQAFAQLVQLARKLEITKIKHSMILRAVNLALYFVSSKVMSFICIILFLLDGGQLSAENVFVTLALVAQIREIMTLNFPLGISYGVETYISVKRIEAFLLENEIKSQFNVISHSANDCRISLNQVSVQLEPNIPILKDISFEVLPGKLTVIIGPVGSGKSSILLAILKEHSISSGSIDIKGKLAFASQEAWIFPGTIRENILFGEPYNSDRFKLAIEMAALSADLAQFPLGVQTVLDDRGTSLSGGQQARISLARALYRDADCYLLDDPLSAVDASVAKHIFEKCIKQYLVDKCVILVTHQLQFIKQADQIVMIKDGECVASGTYEQLANQNIDLFECASIESEEEEGESIASLQTFESIVAKGDQKSNSFEIDEQCDNISLVEKSTNLFEPKRIAN